jgi:hypothetical protein
MERIKIADFRIEISELRFLKLPLQLIFIDIAIDFCD